MGTHPIFEFDFDCLTDLNNGHTTMAQAAANISKKRKHVAEGVFKAELDGFLRRELAEDGYSGVEVRITPKRTEIIVLATRTQNVLGEKAKRIRELTALVQKRFQMKDGQVELFAEKVANRGLCATAQCESMRYKLMGGLAVRRAAYGVLRFIMESGAKGCEVVISGKLRGQRAKAMKFTDGLMIHTGFPVTQLARSAPRPPPPISSRSASQRRRSHTCPKPLLPPPPPRQPPRSQSPRRSPHKHRPCFPSCFLHEWINNKTNGI